MSVRIVIVSGPSKGATYFIRDGQNTIGRGADSDICLEHSQVSKRHCVLIYAGGKLELLDSGSANGTFVNGVLSKKKKLRVSDKISVGPFVLEVVAGADSTRAASDSVNIGVDSVAPSINEAPPVRSDKEKSIFKKLFYKFDETVPPVIYDFNTRNEWITVVSGMFGLYVVFYILLSVYPMLETAKESVLQEAERRAFYIARQISDHNQEFLANNQDALMTVDFAERDQSVTDAMIVDLGGRVLAPGARVNETTNNPFIVKHLAAIREGNQKAWSLRSKRSDDQSRVIVTVPIFVRAPKSGLNVPKALVSVTFLLKGISLDSGTIGVVYFESLIIAAIVGFFFIFLTYRLTYHIVDKVNDDIDHVLKGNEPAVPKRYKFQPLDKLIDSVNSALSRIPALKSDESNVPTASDTEQQIIDSLVAPLQLLVGRSQAPAMFLTAETRVAAMNAGFEELSGIHFDSAQGQLISEVSRDDAFAAMMHDLVHKAAGMGVQGVTEEFEFSSGLHQVQCVAVFSLPEKIEGYLLFIEAVAGEA